MKVNLNFKRDSLTDGWESPLLVSKCGVPGLLGGWVVCVEEVLPTGRNSEQKFIVELMLQPKDTLSSRVSVHSLCTISYQAETDSASLSA